MSKRFSGRWSELCRALAQWVESAPEVQIASSRDLAFQMAWYYAFVLLLSWTDEETGTNQKLMVAWLNEMELHLGKFTLKTEAQCQNSKTAFRDQLKV